MGLTFSSMKAISSASGLYLAYNCWSIWVAAVERPRIGSDGHRSPPSAVTYLLPLARLSVEQSMVRFDRSVAPPFDHAVTWSASISLSL